jgi:hypothetical protein
MLIPIDWTSFWLGFGIAWAILPIVFMLARRVFFPR